MTLFDVIPGDSPVVLAQPHGGTFLPDDLMARLNDNGRSLADTDWHIERLYEAAKAIDIVIQLGAIVAVAVYFRARLRTLLSGLLTRDPASLRLAGALGAAFVPTATVGLLLHRIVKERLFGPLPVAAAPR